MFKNFHLYLLHKVSRLGRQRILDLMEEWGSAEAALEAGGGTGAPLFGRWEWTPWEQEAEILAWGEIKIISYKDRAYPPRLLSLPDFPLILYAQGEVECLAQGTLALVGTRAATVYGHERTGALAKECAQGGVVVVSGLARGIDTAAHRGALYGGGKTAAFLGSGLKAIYPAENQALAEQIAGMGVLVSEYPPLTQPQRGLFPRRNRLLSGSTEGTVLMESPLEGGSMQTLAWAHAQGRGCFALPGRVDWPSFAGNHHLIKTQKAHLIENLLDIQKHIPIKTQENIHTGRPTPSSPLSEEERGLLARMPPEECSVETLVLLTQLPVMKLNVLLTRLALKKVIKEYPGKLYKKPTD